MSAKKETIRVANIIEEARIGGPQNRIADVAARLLEENIKTTVIIPEKDSQLLVKKLISLGVDYKTLNLHKLTRDKAGQLSFLFHFLGDIWQIRKAIKDCGATIVHCNSASQWKGVIAAKLSTQPSLWHLNDTDTPKLVLFVFKRLAGWVSGFIPAAQRVSTYYLKDQFRAIPRFLIQAPVNCTLYDPENYTANRKEENNDRIEGTVVNVLSIGNISPVKDIECYINMAQHVHNAMGQEANFTLIGEALKSQNDYLAKINQLNTPNESDIIAMKGRKKDVRPFLAAADIYVCSSRFEASPISIWEAMAMGLPIVATDVGDLALMNEKGDFAYIVPTEDPVALADAVLKLANNPEERHRLGENARKYALENFDIEICVRKHVHAYRAIAQSA